MNQLIEHILKNGSNIRGRPATAEEIQALETDLGTRLPVSYREFLGRVGCLIPSINRNAEVHGLGTDGLSEDWRTDDVLSFTKSYSEADFKWPATAVCISPDGRGGCYCLDTARIAGDDCPVVYFDHELADEHPVAGRFVPRFQEVAASFEAWLERLMRTGWQLPD